MRSQVAINAFSLLWSQPVGSERGVSRAIQNSVEVGLVALVNEGTISYHPSHYLLFRAGTSYLQEVTRLCMKMLLKGYPCKLL